MKGKGAKMVIFQNGHLEKTGGRKNSTEELGKKTPRRGAKPMLVPTLDAAAISVADPKFHLRRRGTQSRFRHRLLANNRLHAGRGTPPPPFPALSRLLDNNHHNLQPPPPPPARRGTRAHGGLFTALIHSTRGPSPFSSTIPPRGLEFSTHASPRR